MNIKFLSIVLFFSLTTQTALASVAGKIRGAQFPGWIERGEKLIAIHPGFSVEEGDLIRTGVGGKVMLSMEDGSDIKLGNSSKVKIKSVSKSSPENDNVFGMALNVLKGVFRFTTSAIAKSKKRDLSISFGTVTAGIRGTDIWGRVNSEKDLVCLIEGKIDVSHPQSETVRLDQARQYYDASKNSAGSLKGKVEAEQLTKWAQLTELEHEQGLMSENGQWSVVLMSLLDNQYAQLFSQKLNSQGYPAEVVETDLDGVTVHRVIIKQFERYSDAVNAQKRLNILDNVENAWVKEYSF